MKIVLSEYVWDKLKHIATHSGKVKREMSGYGICNYNKKSKEFYISDIESLHIGSSAETEIQPEDYNRQAFKWKDHPGAQKFHFHTHPNMGAFWSATDKALIRQHGSNGWMTFLVLNEKFEVKAAFYQIVEVMGESKEWFIEDIPVSVDTPAIDEEILKLWDQEIKDLETKFPERKYTGSYYSPSYKGGWDEYEDYSQYGDLIDYYDDTQLSFSNRKPKNWIESFFQTYEANCSADEIRVIRRLEKAKKPPKVKYNQHGEFTLYGQSFYNPMMDLIEAKKNPNNKYFWFTDLCYSEYAQIRILDLLYPDKFKKQVFTAFRQREDDNESRFNT